jgi:hypothetical protein
MVVTRLREGRLVRPQGGAPPQRGEPDRGRREGPGAPRDPLSAGRTTAALLWFFLKIVLTLVVFRWVFDFTAERGRPFPAWVQAAVVLLSLRPIMSDLHHGNINLFVLFLAPFAERHRSDETREACAPCPTANLDSP